MKRRLFAVPVAFLLLFALTIPAFAASSTLSVTEIDQNKSTWCWAACGEMVGKYYSSSSGHDQYDIVKKVKGNTDDQSGSASDVCSAIKYAASDSVTFTYQNSALSFSSCQSEIDADDPFVVWLSGKNGSLSHVVVASGYKTGTTNYLNILDPSPNVDEQYFSYTDLVNGTTGTLGTRSYNLTVLRK